VKYYSFKIWIYTKKKQFLMFPSVLSLHHVWKHVQDSAYCFVLWKTFSLDSCYVSHRSDTEYTHARTHTSCQGNSLIYNTKFPSFCMTTLQLQSHKPYDPPNPVKWMQQQHKLTYTGTFTIQIAGKAALRAHDFAHSPELWRQPRFTKVVCAWS
jgi:hypothetical protein